MRNEKGVVQILVLLLLLAGLGAGVYLVQQQTNIFPKAYNSKPKPKPPVSIPIPPRPTPGPHYSFDEFLTTFGKQKSDPGFKSKYDVNNDGIVNILDFTALIEKFDLGNRVFKPPYNLTAFMNAFGKKSGNNGYNKLYDLNKDSYVNILDWSILVTEYSVTPAPSPQSSCLPRPACLDKNPRCLLAEPKNGWCPTPISSPIPTSNPGGTGGSNGSPSGGISKLSR